MTYRFTISLCLFVSLFLLFAGCGGEKLPPGIPKLYPATITVTQDNKPLAGAEIIILNVDSTSSWSAGGVTDQQGVLKLRTMGRYEGAPAGKYKVAVNKIAAPDIQLPIEMPTEPGEVRKYNQLVKQIEDNTFYLVDPKFSLGATQLEVEITPSNLHVTVDVSPAIRVKVPPAPRG